MDTPPQRPAESPSLAVAEANERKSKSSPRQPRHRRGSALVRVLIAVLVLAIVAEAAGTGYDALVAHGVVRGAELPSPPFVRVSAPSRQTNVSGYHEGTPEATATTGQKQAPDFVALWLSQTSDKVANNPNYAWIKDMSQYQDFRGRILKPGNETSDGTTDAPPLRAIS